MNLQSAIFLSFAGGLGGGINAVAGSGSFVAFPALLFTGVPPIPANATNTLAFCPVLRGRLSSSPTSPSPLVACLIPLALPLQQVTAREKPLSKAQQNQDLRTGSHRRFVAGKRRCVSWNADHQLIGPEVPLHGGRSGCNRCLRGLLGTSWGQEKLFGNGPEAAN